jgi:hypothetical protein
MEGQANYAFFPLYPLCARALGHLVGIDPFIPGLVVSNVALVAAGTLLRRLVASQHEAVTSDRMLALLFLYPTSFYFSAFLTEATYLALVVGCFWAASERRWWLSWVIASACEYLSNLRWQPKRVGIEALGGLLPFLALAIHAAFLRRITGDALAFVHVQDAWHRRIGNPLRTLATGLSDDPFPAVYACVVIGLLVWGWRSLRPAELLFTGYSFLLPLSTSLMGIPRMCSTIFPLWLIVAHRTRSERMFRVHLGFLAFVQLVFFVLWVNGFGEMS